MLHGRLYVSEHYLGFTSSIFTKVKINIPITELLSVCEANQAIIFPNALKVFVKPSFGGDSSYFFGSFGPGQRSKAFTLLNSLINGTFNPKDYDVHTTAHSRTLSDVSTSESRLSDTMVEGMANVHEDGDFSSTMDEKAPDHTEMDSKSFPFDDEKSTKLSSSLEFGSLRPPDSMNHNVEMKELLSTHLDGISAKVWFRLFVADAALFTAEQYHRARGDVSHTPPDQASGACRQLDDWLTLRSCFVHFVFSFRPNMPARLGKTVSCSTAIFPLIGIKFVIRWFVSQSAALPWVLIRLAY